VLPTWHRSESGNISTISGLPKKEVGLDGLTFTPVGRTIHPAYEESPLSKPVEDLASQFLPRV